MTDGVVPVPGSGRNSGPGPWDNTHPGADRSQVLAAMRLAVRVGEVMVANTETSADCQYNMRRILTAYGVTDCSVRVVLNAITLSWLPPEGEPVTLVRVVAADQAHLHRLSMVERLVGRIERGEITAQDADRLLEDAATAPDPYRGWIVVLARLVSVAGWVVFSGGNWVSAVVGVVATAVALPVVGIVSRMRIPDIFSVLAGAIVVVLVPDLVVWAGVDFPAGSAAVGGLYQFLPGRLLVASVRDGLSGAPLTALARGLQAIVLAVAVAVGVLVGLRVAELLGIVVPSTPTGQWGIMITVLGAGAAVGALAIGRQVPLAAVVPVTMLGMVVWLVANVIAPSGDLRREVAVGIAALLLGFAGRLLARVQGTVSALYTGVAVLVLAPGTLLYQAILDLTEGNTEAGAEGLLSAVFISVSIAAGTTLGLAVGRAVPSLTGYTRLGPPPRLTIPSRRVPPS